MAFDFNEYIEANTLRLEASSRGGGIEIDAAEYTGIAGAKISAYQNYLGGGLLGSVQSDQNFALDSSKRTRDALKLADALKRYYHNITNEDLSEWEASDYDANQNRPGSAY